MNSMKKIFIKEKLKNIGFELENISLGDFDIIGEYTAKKARDPTSELFKSAGCFFRPNYERGILLYSLVSTFNIESYLEIGFGRGYSSLCVAKAMCDLGIDGKITTIDPALDEDFISNLTKFYPKEWFDKIKFIKGTSSSVMSSVKEEFDLIYIDGDHRYDAVKSDWEMTKNLYKKFIIFDDYHLPGVEQKDIDVASVVDDIDDETKELIITDRRIFFDDRQIADDDINYGQVILTNKSFDTSQYIVNW